MLGIHICSEGLLCGVPWATINIYREVILYYYYYLLLLILSSMRLMYFILFHVLIQPHRVLLPDDEVKWRSVRQSMAFFVHPDNEIVVKCIDGSNKYPPITAREDTDRRLKATYDQ